MEFSWYANGLTPEVAIKLAKVQHVSEFLLIFSGFRDRAQNNERISTYKDKEIYAYVQTITRAFENSFWNRKKSEPSYKYLRLLKQLENSKQIYWNNIALSCYKLFCDH